MEINGHLEVLLRGEKWKVKFLVKFFFIYLVDNSEFTMGKCLLLVEIDYYQLIDGTKWKMVSLYLYILEFATIRTRINRKI